MAMPRQNNISFWLQPPSLGLLVLGLFSGGAATGWTVLNNIFGYSCQDYVNNLQKTQLDAGNSSIIGNINGKYYSQLNASCKNVLDTGTIRLDSKDLNQTIHQRLNVGHPDINDEAFLYWQSGVTDGDGTLRFYQNKNGGWDFTFKITQSSFNIRLQIYIKKRLKVGSITYDKSSDSYQYRIRNRQLQRDIIIPIFEKAPLLTRKEYDFHVFKKALNISLSNLENKDSLLQDLKSTLESIPEDFIANFWLENANKSVVQPQDWVVGFTEAEGSFYLTKKAESRIVHGFGWTQKYDKQILESQRDLFKIKAIVKRNSAGFWSLDSTSSMSVERAMKFYFKRFKGIKSLQFRVWSRTYTKDKGDYNKLSIIKEWFKLRGN